MTRSVDLSICVELYSQVPFHLKKSFAHTLLYLTVLGGLALIYCEYDTTVATNSCRFLSFNVAHDHHETCKKNIKLVITSPF
jgi:hypothetical protein